MISNDSLFLDESFESKDFGMRKTVMMRRDSIFLVLEYWKHKNKKLHCVLSYHFSSILFFISFKLKTWQVCIDSSVLPEKTQQNISVFR